MNMHSTRRRFLRSSTALIALPALESLGFRRFAVAAEPVTPPKRVVFLSFGFGVTNATWYPDINQPGADYELSDGLKPLARHKADFSVVQGLWNKYSNEGHWGSTMWLTGANRFAQPGQGFQNTISADQVAADQFGLNTRFASLQLNSREKADLMGHGPGLSLAWDVHGKPIGGQNNPLEAYHRLFSKDTTPIEQQQAMLAERRSVLDTVLENARAVQGDLSKQDAAKLDEYFDSIRDIETRLSKDERWLGIPQPKAPLPEPKPGLAGREEIQLMYDIITAAIKTDSTRVITYRQPVGTLLTSLGVKVLAHDMSHHGGRGSESFDASQQRDVAQSELLAGLIDSLKATKEPDGTSLFDHTTIVYGSNIRTAHSLDNCPTIVAGRGTAFKLGHNHVLTKGTPLCNLWLGLLQGMGVNVERHGDSTGPLTQVFA